jgi:hypothetical protein
MEDRSLTPDRMLVTVADAIDASRCPSCHVLVRWDTDGCGECLAYEARPIDPVHPRTVVHRCEP